MRGTGAGGTAGADPDGLRLLGRELEDAAAALDQAAAVVRSALDDAGVAGTEAAELEELAAWCEAEASDVMGRAASAEVAGAALGAVAVLFAAPPAPAPTGEGRRLARFLALAGLTSADRETEAWLATAMPALAARRSGSREALADLERARGDVAVRLYTGDIGRAEAEAELARLDRAADDHVAAGTATAADMAAFLAELDDAEVRELAAEVVERLGDAGEGDGDRSSLRAALRPLHDRLRDQLAEAARQAYMGATPRHGELDELARLVKALSLPAGEERGNVFVAFLRGLVAGDADQSRSADVGEELARSVGHTLSGLVALGDVRDTAANLAHGRWGDGALSALGIIPFVGDVVKGADTAAGVAKAARASDAATDAAKAARAADDAAGAARRGADDAMAALRGTPLEHWKPGQPLPNAENATIDPRKFESYSMDPGNLRAGRKPEAFAKLGYDVQGGRNAAAADIGRQIRAHLERARAFDPAMSEHGARISVEVVVTGPNGRKGTLFTRWQYDHGTNVPKLITNYVKVHQ